MAAMRVDRPETLEALPTIVAGWGLAGACPVVVLVGGAGSMEGEAGRNAARAIADAVVPAVEAAGAALLTGGTDAGVMRMAGERRRAVDGRFPLVGVVPAGRVALPGEAPFIEGAEAAAEPAEAAVAPAAPAAPAATLVAALPAQVQPDHTHLLAVPGDRWGAETPWLFALADAIGQGHRGVTVVLNGGLIARAEIAESVRRGRPVIVVEGTGRAADEIASALAEGRPAGEGDPDAALRETGLVRAVRFDEDGALRAALGSALAPALGDPA